MIRMNLLITSIIQHMSTLDLTLINPILVPWIIWAVHSKGEYQYFFLTISISKIVFTVLIHFIN